MGAPLTDGAIRKLREMIVSGRYPSGAKLPPEAELAAELGLSRSTARAAVRALSTARVLDVRILEPGATVLAASNIDAGALANLEETLIRMQESSSNLEGSCVTTLISTLRSRPHREARPSRRCSTASPVGPSGSTFEYEAVHSDVLARVRRIAGVCSRHDVSMAAALQFPLAHPAISAVCFGARSAEEVRQNVELGATSLPPGFSEDLRAEELLSSDLPVSAESE